MPPTLLIVDDDVDLANNLAALLRHFSFDVLIATDAVEGLEMALVRRPAIIFTDYQMPTLNGVQLALAVRNAPGMGDTPVVIMTGAPDALPETAKGILVLAKPLQLATIFEAVSNKLKDRL